MANSKTLMASIKKLDVKISQSTMWIGDEAGFAVDGLSKHLTGASGDVAKVYLGNAFSLQMVAPSAIIAVEECLPEDVPVGAVSCIGHPDTAAVVSGCLGREVACNRTSISLGDGDVLYVAQLTGGRLPEGATRLPEGFTLTFRRVVVHC